MSADALDSHRAARLSYSWAWLRPRRSLSGRTFVLKMILTPACWSEPSPISRFTRAANSSAGTTLRRPVRLAFSCSMALRRVSGSVMASARHSRTAKVLEPFGRPPKLPDTPGWD